MPHKERLIHWLKCSFGLHAWVTVAAFREGRFSSLWQECDYCYPPAKRYRKVK